MPRITLISHMLYLTTILFNILWFMYNWSFFVAHMKEIINKLCLELNNEEINGRPVSLKRARITVPKIGTFYS